MNPKLQREAGIAAAYGATAIKFRRGTPNHLMDYIEFVDKACILVREMSKKNASLSGRCLRSESGGRP